MTNHPYLKGLLIALAGAMCSFAVSAQVSVPNIIASFTINNEQIVGDNVAIADHVELISDGYYDPSSEYFLIPASGYLTIKAEEFQNICYVSLTACQYVAQYVTCTLVSAKGPGIEGINDLNIDLSPKPTTSSNILSYETADIYTFNFGANVKLSEVTFKFNDDFYLYRAAVTLNVAPEVAENELKLYADDVVPFEKKSNVVPYQYFISDNADQFEDIDSDQFKTVPDEGITLSGKPDGKYAVYIQADPYTTNVFQPQRAIINYEEKATSTLINNIPETFKLKYYDLNGHQLAKPVRGITIIKNLTTGTISKILLP